MSRQLCPSRLFLTAAVVFLAAAPMSARIRQPRSAPPQRMERQQRPAERPAERPQANNPRAPQNQEHLQQWMENHKNLSLPDQQRALQNEPGFRDLPPKVQQRYHDRLAQLYNMTPQRRDRTLERNEMLERLTPMQRQQYDGAVQAFATMPANRRRVMARAILDLREMPPDQREQVIGSPRFAAQFSDSERSTISTLLTAEPYPPIAP